MREVTIKSDLDSSGAVGATLHIPPMSKGSLRRSHRSLLRPEHHRKAEASHGCSLTPYFVTCKRLEGGCLQCHRPGQRRQPGK